MGCRRFESRTGIVTPGGPPSPPLTRRWGGIQKNPANIQVQIELKLIDQRDLLMSYASNLQNGAKIDIVIPDPLKVTARKLARA